MSQGKANVETIQLGRVQAADSKAAVIHPVEMPVRSHYSEAEKKPKKRSYFVSYCLHDTSHLADEFKNALTKFVAAVQRKGDSAETSAKDGSAIRNSIRHVVFLTPDYLASPKCLDEFRSSLAQLKLLQRLLILRTPEAISLLDNAADDYLFAKLKPSERRDDTSDASLISDDLLEIIGTREQEARLEQVHVLTVSAGEIEIGLRQIEER